MREQLEVLEYHADPGPQLWQIGLRVADRNPLHRDGAFLERFECVDAFDQRRFAGPRWSAHHDDLAFGDIGRTIFQYLNLAVPFADLGDSNHGRSTDDGYALLQAAHAVGCGEGGDEVDEWDGRVRIDKE